MSWILSPRGRAALDELAGRNSVLAFDFDGTLAPIVTDPRRARMRARTRRLLERLARVYPCAVISGRSLGDLTGHLEGVGLCILVGNHGAEWAPERARGTRAIVAAWRRKLVPRIARLPGVELEDKGLSLSIHYRRARDPSNAASAAHAAASALPGARVVPGKRVVNVLPVDAPHKGAALTGVRRMLACEAALYVGDDVTDEDAFAIRERWLVSIRVGRKRTTRASYYLRAQREIDELLAHLVAARAGDHEARSRKNAK